MSELMHELASELDSMFADAPIAEDEIGSLRLIAACLEPLRAEAMFLADDAGQILASSRRSGAIPDATLQEVAHTVASPHTPRDLVVTGVRGETTTWPATLVCRILGGKGADGFFGALFESTPDPFQLTPQWKENLTARLALAWQAERSRDELGLSRTRLAHLTKEQETLRVEYSEIVARILQEREDRLNEKREHILQLESQVAERSAELHEAIDRAEHASRAKSEFLANMSHEIRTPMTAILGFAETLLEPQLAEKERDEAVRTICRNGEYLLELINDILDLSKIESGKLSVDRTLCSPCQIVADVHELMRHRAHGKGIELHAEFQGQMPDVIQSDPLRLRQILINLIGNAVKFTEHGSVRMVVQLVDDNAESLLQVDVVDTGIGMTDTQTKRLFKPFMQADASTTRRFGGTGLGLSISKRLAESLGGDIRVVDSRPGVGTRMRATVSTGSLDNVIWIESPQTAVESAAEAASRADVSAAGLSGLRILLAEDGPDNQRLISHALRKVGADVTLAENGDIAVTAASAALEAGQPFDAILMDMQMPVLDGYGATRKLRESGYLGSVIALTANAMSGDRAKCIEAGCNDYATKPIDRKELTATILRHAAKPEPQLA